MPVIWKGRQPEREGAGGKQSPKALIKRYMWQSRQTTGEERWHLWQSDTESFQRRLLCSCWRNPLCVRWSTALALKGSFYHLSLSCHRSAQHTRIPASRAGKPWAGSQIIRWLDRQIQKGMFGAFFIHSGSVCYSFMQLLLLGWLGSACFREKAGLHPQSAVITSEHQQEGTSCIIHAIKTSRLCKIGYPTSCASEAAPINRQKLQRRGSPSGHKLKR